MLVISHMGESSDTGYFPESASLSGPLGIHTLLDDLRIFLSFTQSVLGGKGLSIWLQLRACG